jgi:hypothetical protein
MAMDSHAAAAEALAVAAGVAGALDSEGSGDGLDAPD